MILVFHLTFKFIRVRTSVYENVHFISIQFSIISKQWKSIFCNFKFNFYFCFFFCFFWIWEKLKIDFWQFSIKFLIFIFEKWKNYRSLKSCLDLKDPCKSFKRDVKIIIQGAFIQKTETLLLKRTKISHLKHMKKGIIPISRA